MTQLIGPSGVRALPLASGTNEGEGTLGQNLRRGLGEMFKGDSADTCAVKFSLMLMGG